MKRVAIYARVSSHDKGQDVRQQLPDLKQYIEQIGAELVAEYIEEASGATDKRAQFQALLLGAREQRFDLVLFWALDRLSQEGPRATLNHLHALKCSGVDFHSYTEPFLDTNTPIGEGTVALVAAQAAQAIAATSVSVKRALGQKKGNGVVLGRPPIAPDVIVKARALRAEKKSLRKISAEVGVPVATIHRYLRETETPADLEPC